MASFEELLKKTLGGVNEAFAAAINDLNGAVASASEGLSRVTNSAAKLQLSKLAEYSDSVLYKLSLVSGASHYELMGFKINAKGYPILAGELTVGDTDLLSVSSSISDKQMLAGYFEKMASNPDSRLVQTAAFVMRKHAGAERKNKK